MLAIVAWTLFAFGGAYAWTLVPLFAGAAAFGAAARPRLFQRGSRAVDALLCVAFCAAALQLLPLPSSIRLTLSPSIAPLERQLRLDASGTAPGPLTIDRDASVEALSIFAVMLVVFWGARSTFERGGLRRASRAIALCGGGAAAMAVVQHATAPRLLYWTWRPERAGAAYPFTPFVNRNDLAAWLIMALPLAGGYLLARIQAHRRGGPLTIDAVFDAAGASLSIAICAMAAGLVTTVSRSGLIGGVAGASALVLLTHRRMEGRGRAWMIAGISIVAVVGAGYANTSALMTRVDETLDAGIGGRAEIWRVTAAVVRDFPATGVGIGAFERAMTIYQPPHDFAFNHAHNEYLQLAAEGGLLLAVPALCAIAAGVASVRRRMQADRTPVFWIRAGAAAGLTAIAVQSLWETGLRMPANAVLFAVCAAIATHRPHVVEREAAAGRTGVVR